MKQILGQLTRLIEISLTLNSTLDQDRILQFIINTASDILNCEAVSILLYDDKKEELRIAASTDSNPEELAKIPVPLDSSIAGTIFTENAPQIINNPENNPLHFQGVDEKIQFETRSLVGVPMQIRDTVTGVLEGLNKRDGEFTKADVDILSVIASQAAVAINNAHLMNSLQHAYEELSQIDKIKSEFISIASHELRTPLSHILGYAHMLQEETKDGSSVSAKRLLESANQLQSLVDAMTNMNLLEMGSQELSLEKVALQQILVDTYKAALETIKARRHETEFDLPKPPIYIMADSEKLERAFLNILNNAALFTPDGGQIKINVTAHEDHAHVTITDNGIGIPKDELENIFDRFNQVESHLTRAHGGIGLGLPIAKGLVELHGGKIWAESEGANTGTTFQITIPLAQ
jgi:signal transduction histidine kinase